jgi:hypothetical protein
MESRCCGGGTKEGASDVRGEIAVKLADKVDVLAHQAKGAAAPSHP